MASLALVLWALWAVVHFCTAHAKLEDLLVATARGGFALREFLAGNLVSSKALLSSKDEFGFSSLTVAAYNGDWQAAEELLKHGASLTPGEITVSMREGNVNVGSVVELMVRRSSMLIMLGTGFNMPSYLDKVQKQVTTAMAASSSAPEVPDMARTLEVLMRAGAQATEKSQEVDVLVHKVLKPNPRAASRALNGALLGISQLKHRLNRALLQQPRMAGRLFRDYYGFDIESEAKLLDPNFQSLSFEDTVRMVMGKARQVVRHLIEARADPSFAQSKQSGKTPLHHCSCLSFLRDKDLKTTQHM